MKMSVEEILACEISEGPFKLAMGDIREDIKLYLRRPIPKDQKDKRTASLCAAFSALCELAKYPVGATIDGLSEGRAEREKEILAIVDAMAATWVVGPGSIDTWDGPTLRALRQAITKKCKGSNAKAKA